MIEVVVNDEYFGHECGAVRAIRMPDCTQWRKRKPRHGASAAGAGDGPARITDWPRTRSLPHVWPLANQRHTQNRYKPIGAVSYAFSMPHPRMPRQQIVPA